MDIDPSLAIKTSVSFSGFETLKSAAKQHDPKAAQTVAKQFEALFLQMMLKDMRKAATSFGESFLSSKEEEYYTEMFDKEIALKMATTNKGLGLAQVIERQLLRNNSQEADAEILMDEKLLSRTNIRPQLPNSEKVVAIKNDPVLKKNAENTIAKDEINSAEKSSLMNFSTPDEFVKNLMPLAKEFAKKLGVKPEVLLAQAALETGWGKTIQGKLSNNLFGVKATSNWEGKRIAQNTVEFENGVFKKKNEVFRIYDSLRDSFQDYVDFLKNNPRYQEALQKTSSPFAFANALQDAGYATDPHYAKKIMNIFEKMR
jgi:flagellar protein FlgJ